MPSLASTFAGFFRDVAPLAPGDRLLVAFSGGPDSTALLAGLVPFAAERGVELRAAHLDHACDAGSAARAVAAGEIARRLGVPMTVERRPATGPGSPEEVMRRVRYAFLEEVAAGWGGRYIATGHTRDDQAETVVLRLLAGTGLDGLAAIAPRRGRVVRPLLELDRAAVHAALPAELVPVNDPGNASRVLPRSWVRHELLPRLAVDEPEVEAALAAVAARARRAREVLEGHLLERLEAEVDAAGPTFSRDSWAALPAALGAAALAALARRAGFERSLGREARRELLRQLAASGGPHGRVGCDAAGGLRVESLPGGRLRLAAPAREAWRPAAFSYTLELPGEVRIPELAASVRVTRAGVEPWMFRGEPTRAALDGSLEAATTVTVRSRLPGDRLRPLGAPGERKLKEVLIDQRVPRERRDRLPLVVADGRIAWVPGVTIDEAYRIAPGSASAWVVEVLPR